MPDDNKSKTQKCEKNLCVVGVGASAGGLEALRALFAEVHNGEKFAFIVVQHLAPTHKSRLVELIAHTAHIDVEEIANNTKIQANRIYICPPNKDVFVENDKLVLKEPRAKIGPKPSVDLFFHSLASSYEDKAIGIILSGTGSDGSHGIRAIKAQGGITISQKISDAKYDGMPKSAINTGAIDLELTPSEIAKNLENLGELKNKIANNGEDENSPFYDQIMSIVKRKAGVDFKEYKPSTIHRRLHRRMVALQLESLEDYAQYMRENADEAQAFFQDALISVTSFFRDSDFFEALNKELEKRFESKHKDPFRIWVVGCATGEEAYTIAIMISEIIEKKSYSFSYQIFATDLDEPALEIARKGYFPKSSFENFPSDLKNKYFNGKDDGFKIRNDVRDTVVFAKHNVINDPPFLNIDLISCRNVLIYFGRNLQDRVLNTFHYSLADKGLLFLGKSENVPADHTQFESKDKGAKIYRKIPGSHRSKLQGMGKIREEGDEYNKSLIDMKVNSSVPDIERIKEIVEGIAPNSILLDKNHDVQHIFGDAGERLKFATGQMTNNILKLVDKKLAMELSSLLHRANSKDAPVIGRQNESPQNDVIEITQIKVLPVKNFSHYRFIVVFERFEAPSISQDEISDENQDEQFKKLQQELAFTRQHLQNVVEEHETANEELQSLNEEMQSTNEELQSANEELETTNEELQSSNEELTTLNEELNVKSSELQIANSRMEAIQQAIVYPLIIIDEGLKIVGFNEAARSLLRITDNDIGHFIKSIHARFDLKPVVSRLEDQVNQLKNTSFQFIEGDRQFEIKIQPIQGNKGEAQGAVISFVENTEILNALSISQTTEKRMSNILENIPSAVCKKDLSGVYVYVNQRFLDVHGLNEAEVLGHTDEEIFDEQVALKIRERDLEVLKSKKAANIEEIFRLNGKKTYWSSARIPLFDERNRPQSICWVSTNVTKRKERELKLEVFQSAISLATHGVAVFENNENLLRSVFVSDSLTEDLGLRHGDLDNLTIESFFQKAIPKTSHLSADSILNSLQKEMNQSFVVENNLRNKKRFLEYKCSIIKETKKNLEGVVVTVFDVTEKLSNERTIQKQQEELMRFGRYASLGEISAGFAHEINTPLNVILSNLDLLNTLADRGELNSKESHKISNKIEEVVSTISGIVQGMKSVAGNHEKNRELIDVTQMIKQSIQIAEFRLQRFGVQVRFEEVREEIIIECWKVQVVQILINLINNSIDAIEDLKEKWIMFLVNDRGSFVEIIAQDSGRGIDKKLAEKVMTPFFTTKERKNDKGTGIGLSLSRSIARNHGGELSIDHSQKHTTFVLKLPKKCENPPRTKDRINE